MTVEVKKVGNYKIHVKETKSVMAFGYFLWTLLILAAIGCLCLTIYISDKFAILALGLIIFWWVVGTDMMNGEPSSLIISKIFTSPAYYVDTTMYGVGGETILKTTPEQDHIAICRAGQKFEKEILERIKRENELKEIVGTCK